MVLTRRERGERLWNEGDVADGVHVVVAGRFAVRAMTSDGDEATLAILGDGDVFGEMALLGPDQRRTASVVALERSRTRWLPLSDWRDLRSRHREIDDFVAQLLAGYVLRLGERLTETLFVPAETRVVRQLVRVCEKYRAGSSPGATVRLTGQELADLAGVSRQTVSNLLGRERSSDAAAKQQNETARQLAALGVQVEGRGRIHVPDVDGLALLADTLKQSIRT
jgi:CRP-like cAMP-binding protein